MQYGHLPSLGERRDSNLDSNGSTPFQTHQSLTQALGPHIPQYRTDYRHPSTSPPSHPQPSPLFTVPSSTSPNIKRKHVDHPIPQQVLKRNRRELDDSDPYDLDPAGQGAKHWTDEEKSKLFTWLMGAGQDEHWNALRATKNSCLRECAMDVFGSKKTYQALKGCYERNFNLFKQIYAFEQYHAPNNDLSHLSEADRLREYERRLSAARKAGCDVGNITARIIEHWHRRGWYELFYRRWHGDPATTRPSQSRNNNNPNNNQNPLDDTEADDDHQSQPPPLPQQQTQPPTQSQPPPQPQNPSALDFSDPTGALTNGINGFSHLNYINPQSLRDNPLVPPSPATVPTGPNATHSSTHPGSTNVTAATGGPTVGGGGGGAATAGPSSLTSNPAVNGAPPSSSTSNSHPHISSLGTHPGSHTTANLTSSSSGGGGGGIGGGVGALPPPSASSSVPNSSIPPGSQNDQPVVNVSITQNMLSTYLQFLQVQTQTGKMKLEYLRRREEREEKDSVQRREMERMKLEREAAEFEHSKHSANTKQKADRAIELLSNPSIDASVKHAASEFLKKLFASD